MDNITNEIININPKALNEKLQVITKNHLIIILICFAVANVYLFGENKKTQNYINEYKDKTFDKIVVVIEKQTQLQEQTNTRILALENITIDNGKKLDFLTDKTK